MALARGLRRIVFWLHLLVGASAGLVVLVMAGTGMCLAFRPELTAWAERSVRQVEPTTSVTLSYSLMLDAVRDARPDARPMMATLSHDPRQAAVFQLGRDEVAFVDPCSGDVVPSNRPKVRAFFAETEQLHRWLGLQGPARPLAQAVTRACCVAMLFLVLSGLYLWWPPRSTWATLGNATRLHFSRRGYARDRNWHEVAGFWTLPALLVSTTTGIVMAYPNLADRILGARPGLPAAAVAPEGHTAAKPKNLSIDRQIAAVEAAYPNWDTLVVRPGNRPRGDDRAGQGQTGAEKRTAAKAAAPGGPPGNRFVVRLTGWPARQLEVTVDPTGQVVAAADSAQQSWLRTLRGSAKQIHTGEAGGWPLQGLVGFGALGAVTLIATGFSLLVRRIARTLGRRRPAPAPTARPVASQRLTG